MDPNNADIIREVVECLGDISSPSGNQNIPEAFEKKLKKSAIEQLSDSTELRLLLIASLFTLRDSQRQIKEELDLLRGEIKTIDGRVKDRLIAMRGAMG